MVSLVPDCLSISGNRLLIRAAFEEINFNKSKSVLQINNEKNLRENFPTGLITRKIKMRMTRIIDVWLKSLYYSPTTETKHKLFMPTFITLTLPAEQMHSDKDLNSKGLNRLLIKIKRSHSVKNYLWRAERQKNGNIHYHILVDKYISYKLINHYWNCILSDLGYIDKYRENQKLFHAKGFKVRTDLLSKWSYEKQLKAYRQGIADNWSNPNTTDIHSLKKVKNVTAYICKYTTKCDEYKELQEVKKYYADNVISEQTFKEVEAKILKKIEKNKINSRCWGCSDEIRNLKEPKIIIDGQISKFIDEALENHCIKDVQNDMFRIIYCNDLIKLINKHSIIRTILKNHYCNIFNALYFPEKVFKDVISKPHMDRLIFKNDKKPYVPQLVLF